MDKAYIKQKWSKYCDTDKLVDDMISLLRKYNHRYSEHGVCTVLDNYFTNKEPLIKLLATSKHYIGDMRIAVRKEFEREIDKSSVRNFCNNFPNNIGASKMILCYKDDDGKTVSDYFQTGYKKANIKDIVSNNVVKRNQEKLNNFDLSNGATKKSSEKFEAFNRNTLEFYNIYSSTMPKDLKIDDIEIVKGTKTSRAFNKVCIHYGLDKANNYNKLFAEYADLVSTTSRELYFIISVNPLDYLTMSIGKSWSSCHSINGGAYQNGCMSYLSDATSIITFVIDSLDEPIQNAGKIYRQMFHYADNIFMQSRLYPQANDGATNLYDKFREMMQEEFGELLNLKQNEWKHITGASARAFARNTGNHYPDIRYHLECGIFYPSEKENEIKGHEPIVIGHESYCPYCGQMQESHSRISHYGCAIGREQ